jgi:hypothetical protein
MEFDADDDGNESSVSLAEREIQLAVAMQHAGFYLLSYNAYQAAKLLATEHGGLDGRLSRRIDIQLAVLDERLGRLHRARSTLASFTSPERDTSIQIAQMSDADWYFVTNMKVQIALGSLKVAKAVMKETPAGGLHFVDWKRAFSSVIRGLANERFTAKDIDGVREASSSYMKYDAPGEPWIPLFAAHYVARTDAAAAIDLLFDAAQRAQRMGKYFLVAAIYEQLARAYSQMPGKSDESKIAFRRSMNGYGRCQLLTHREIRARMGRLGRSLGLEVEELSDLTVRSSSVLLDRSEIRFSTLLADRARMNSSRPDEEFEKFLEEWAPLRYAGRLEPLPRGETAADVLLVREVNGRMFGTAIQAKHYASPRRSIPKANPRLRELGQKYGVTIDQYVFVVSTSDVRGWRDSMWHAQASEGVRNVIVDQTVAVSVVTEPELQTDVVLNDQLLRWLITPDRSRVDQSIEPAVLSGEFSIEGQPERTPNMVTDAVAN